MTVPDSSNASRTGGSGALMTDIYQLSRFDTTQDALRHHPLFDLAGVSEPLTSSALESALPSLEAELVELQREFQRNEAELRQALLDELSEVEAVRQAIPRRPASDGPSPSTGQADDSQEELISLLHALTAAEPGGPAGVSSTLRSLAAHETSLEGLHKAKEHYQLLADAEELKKAIIAAEEAAASTAGADQQEVSLLKLVELQSLVGDHEARFSRPGDVRAQSAASEKIVQFSRLQLASAYNAVKSTRTKALRTSLRHAGWPPALLQGAAAAAAASNAPQASEGSAHEQVVEVLEKQTVREAWFDVCGLQRVADGTATGDPNSSDEARLAKVPSASDFCTAHVGPGQDGYVSLPCTFVLLEPFIQRFAYHFDSDHSSNRLDKPEWFLAHLLDLFKTHLPFWQASAPVRDLYEISGYPADTEKELLNAVLGLAKGKILSSMDMLVKHPSLLAHTLFVALDFDRDLANLYHPSLGQADRLKTEQPLKIAELLLSREEWFEAWLEGERLHALDQLDDILASPDAWAIAAADGLADDERDAADGVPASSDARQKSTTSAREIVDLLEGVTSRYAPLSSLEQQILFITRVQLPMLRQYAQRLTRSLEAFESLSSAFARHIPGGIGIPDASGVVGANTDADMVRGLRGLNRLLKAFISAEYVRLALSRWSEQGLFIEISQSLNKTPQGQHLAKQIKLGAEREEDRALDSASLGSLLRRGIQSGGRAAISLRPLGVGAGASASRDSSTSRSSSAAPRRSGGLEGDDADSVWDEPSAKFGELTRRASQGIERLVVSEVMDALVAYSRR